MASLEGQNLGFSESPCRSNKHVLQAEIGRNVWGQKKVKFEYHVTKLTRLPDFQTPTSTLHLYTSNKRRLESMHALPKAWTSNS
jgi:hypothetical protein